MQLLEFKGVLSAYPVCPATGRGHAFWGKSGQCLTITLPPDDSSPGCPVDLLYYHDFSGVEYEQRLLSLRKAWARYSGSIIAEELTEEHVATFCLNPANARFFEGVDMSKTLLFKYLRRERGMVVPEFTLFNLAHKFQPPTS